jgi:hypothetical protein
VGFGALVRTMKHAFIEGAIAELFPHQASRINISRLSVTTGMPRREIFAYLKTKHVPEPLPKHQKASPAARVLRGWSTDPLFTMGKAGLRNCSCRSSNGIAVVSRRSLCLGSWNG